MRSIDQCTLQAICTSPESWLFSSSESAASIISLGKKPLPQTGDSLRMGSPTYRSHIELNMLGGCGFISFMLSRRFFAASVKCSCSVANMGCGISRPVSVWYGPAHPSNWKADEEGFQQREGLHTFRSSLRRPRKDRLRPSVLLLAAVSVLSVPSPDDIANIRWISLTCDGWVTVCRRSGGGTKGIEEVEMYVSDDSSGSSVPMM